jgi:DNA-binding NtrC family response regulator
MSFEDATATALKSPEDPPTNADSSGMVWRAPSENGFEPVAVDPASLALVERVTRLAASELAVLFTGDEGVGKRTFAAFLHARSRGARGPLVRVSCQVATEAQLEAALFGIEGGAGARAGALERADGGTLLIEHLHALPASFEARLIHVLEFAQVYRVGSVAPRRARVRFLATAPRRPEGRDLVRRLAGAVVEVPPLRGRPADIEPLALRFVSESVVGRVEAMTFTPEARDALLAYDWPGNGRELRFAVERAVVPANDGLILARDLDLPVRSGARTGALHDDVERLERQRIEGALAASGGNRSRAARALGIARNTLLARLKAYGLG